MEIYLDANATTPVLAAARDAALAAMAEGFGNPSSIHGRGLQARALVDQVRACARRVLGVPQGRLLFLSGATEGIQTAVLSALTALRERRGAGPQRPPELLLYGATEHKAVPEALNHWNTLLGLGLELQAIPVDGDGRHDLAWLREHAPRAGLVCTMAANNETGVVSDLDGIAAALQGCPALWLVDGVQALGKLDLQLAARRIDYAPFSGHKLYAPKGIGLLYVRAGAPFTPLMAGGGQEAAQRSGTENMPGIAAFGAVLAALENGRLLRPAATLQAFRERLAASLRDAFPGVVFNAPAERSLPTTLNVSVPGLDSRLLLDLFDAAQVRVSGGSACSAAKALPSHVLQAMGLPAWRAASAVRLSFGPASDEAFIDEACRRIRACGASLRQSCLAPRLPGVQGAPAGAAAPAGADGPADPGPASAEQGRLPAGITRFTVDGACCYVVADAASRTCVVVDPLPELTAPLAQWIACRGLHLAAVLDTHSHGDHASSAAALRAALPGALVAACEVDPLGWPLGVEHITLGAQRLTRLPVPGHTQDSTALLLHGADGTLRFAFVGDTVMPGALGRSDFPVSAPLAFGPSLKALAQAVGPHTPLLPGHDYDDRFACTLQAERRHQPLLDALLAGRMDDTAFAVAQAAMEQDMPLTRHQTLACGAQVCDADADDEATVQLTPEAVLALGVAGAGPQALHLVDVREPYEQHLGAAPALDGAACRETVPLSELPNALPAWLALPRDTPLLFVCRSGTRSTRAAQALRRLGHAKAFSLAGGLALWPAA